jgi:integrase/recombinase XerD
MKNLQNFEDYLKGEKLSPSSIPDHVKNLSYYLTWAEENKIAEPRHTTYSELLGYVSHLKTKSLSIATINIRLNSLRKYYEYLKAEGITDANPAKKLYIKGAVKGVIVSPLSYTELETLYVEYSKPKEKYREAKNEAVHKRNSIILGLMIWQGIHSGELNRIELQDININQGTIILPGGTRSNSRELKLESRQMISLYQYMSETKFSTEKLFACHPHNTMQALVSELKGINQTIRNAAHIRASVILHWMKMYDKRQVQYMAGHRNISSTEHYQVQELTGLIDQLARHHPFG